MNNEFRLFLNRIESNDELNEKEKSSLIIFLKSKLFSNVRVFNREEYADIEYILKDLNYDITKFEALLNLSKNVRNVIGNKGNRAFQLPKTEYVRAIYTVFKELDMDLIGYDKDFYIANVAMARTAYRIVMNDDVINGEIPFIDLTKIICDEYCNDYEKNRACCTVLKLLHRVDMGLKVFEGKYKEVVTSGEFLSMFENYTSLNNLHISDLIEEFYPIFENELFSLINNILKENEGEKVDTEYVFKCLTNIKQRREEFNRKKTQIVDGITKIDVDTQKKTEYVFSDLIESISSNKSIDKDVKENIINNINNVFNEYSRKQRVFVGNQLDVFFENCSSFINDLLLLNDKKNGIDELISDLVVKCKDFFIEYDSKKFKDIVDYIMENTDLSFDDLRGVGNKCASLFKDGDINKLKIIKDSLIEFNDYVNKTFEDNELIRDNIFESVLINNPELLLKNNNISDVLGFLKGEISLSDRGYHYRNLTLEKGFLSIDFYKKIIDDNCKILLNSSLERIINNLNYLEGKCGIWNINFKKFNFNENMIYFLLENNLCEVGTQSLDFLLEIFDGEDFKKVVELNPELLMMTRRDLEIIVKRCVLNENQDYGFYDLLSSELYYYNFNEFEGKSEKEIEQKPFKYIDLGLGVSREFDIEEILTSNVVGYNISNDVLNKYEDRRRKMKELDFLLLELEKDETIEGQLDSIIERIVKAYNEVYGAVPYMSYKNTVLDFINTKKDYYEYRINDDIEELEGKKAKRSIYASQKKDSILAIKRLDELVLSIKNEEIKADIIKYTNKIRDTYKIRSEYEENQLTEAIEDLEWNIKTFDREVEFLNYWLTVVGFDESLIVEYETINNKTFNIAELATHESEISISSEEELAMLLENQNVVVFSDSIDLNDIPNDKDFFDKVYKFLGDTDFSVRSKKFMQGIGLNKEFIEKLSIPRNGIWSRRENGTPVRVYFIPVYTKYFTCYYVTGVNYKDHAHLDGGCSSEDVYKRTIKKAKDIKEMVESLSIEAAIEFVKEANKKYEEKMQPIISKIERSAKKKNSKK